MPLTKVDYSKTIIYKIQHREIDELLYVGSTTDFTRRKAEHKRKSNNANGKAYNYKLYKMIRDNGGFDCFNIIVIKEFPCNNKQEALVEEDKIMRQMKCNMNSIRAFTTPEDTKALKKRYNELHKEEILEYHKRNYELKKQKILEYKHGYYEQNKDKIAERKKQKITCECGCVVRKSDLAKHKRSKKHQDLLNMTEQ